MNATPPIDAKPEPRSRPVRVLCCDDNAEVAEALRLKFARVGGIEWSGWLASADELFTKVRSTCPDIVILDFDMPGKPPFEALEELGEQCPDARVIVFSGYVQIELIDRALDAGAWGYVAKNDGEDALVKAIHDVMADALGFSAEVRSASSRER